MKMILTVFAAPGDASAASSQPTPLPVVRYQRIRGRCCVYGRTHVFFETTTTRRQYTIIEPESSRFSTHRRRAMSNGRSSAIDVPGTPFGSAVLKTFFGIRAQGNRYAVSESRFAMRKTLLWIFYANCHCTVLNLDLFGWRDSSPPTERHTCRQIKTKRKRTIILYDRRSYRL